MSSKQHITHQMPRHRKEREPFQERQPPVESCLFWRHDCPAVGRRWPSFGWWMNGRKRRRKRGWIWSISGQCLSTICPTTSDGKHDKGRRLFSKHNSKCNYVFVFRTERLAALVKDPKLYHLTLQEIYVTSGTKIQYTGYFPSSWYALDSSRQFFCHTKEKLVLHCHHKYTAGENNLGKFYIAFMFTVILIVCFNIMITDIFRIH
jgi:hypothetical protein